MDRSRLQLVIDLGAKVSVIGESTYRTGLSRQLEYSYGTIMARLVRCWARWRLLYGMELRHGVDAFPFYVTPSGTDIMGVDLFDALGFRIVM